jgi:hypothetical protein
MTTGGMPLAPLQLASAGRAQRLNQPALASHGSPQSNTQQASMAWNKMLQPQAAKPFPRACIAATSTRGSINSGNINQWQQQS